MKLFFLNVFCSMAIFFFSVPAHADILQNGGFEKGGSGWSGTAMNYFSYGCGSNNLAISPKDGNCYAWFDDANGTSLLQHRKIKRSGRFEASVAVNGKGSVRLSIWAFCPGQDPMNWGPHGISFNTGNSWKVIKTRSRSLNNCEWQWELYIDTNSRVRIDRARFYHTYN